MINRSVGRSVIWTGDRELALGGKQMQTAMMLASRGHV